MNKTTPILAVAVAALFLFTDVAPVEAQSSVGRGWRGYQKIKKGVFEIGGEGLLLFRRTSEPIMGGAMGDEEIGTTTSQDTSWIGGLTPRYFVSDNFALALNANFFLQSRSLEQKFDDASMGTDSDVSFSDQGFLFIPMANYYLRLGNSLFFKPGLGAGYLFGTRETPDPTDADKVIESDLAGFAGRLDLGFAFYASPNWNLKAGLDVLFRNVTETKSVGEGTMAEDKESTATTIDAGFNIGMAYSF